MENKISLDPQVIPSHKINFQWATNLNTRAKAIKFLEENIG